MWGMCSMEKVLDKVNENSVHKVRKIVVCSLMAIQILIASILNAKLVTLDMLPMKYDVLLVLAIVCFNIILWFSVYKKKITVIMSFGSVCLSIVLIVTTSLVFKVDSKVNELLVDMDYEVVQMAAVVSATNPANKIEDISATNVGYDKYDIYVEDFKSNITSKVGFPPSYNEYESAADAITALYEGREEATLINKTYIDTMKSFPGFEDIDERIKIIYTYDIKIKKEPISNDTFVAKDTYVIYINGTYDRNERTLVEAPIDKNSLGDVNILAIVNTKKGTVQLINTPRDYYVPLSMNGQCDKLTHASTYGINVSVETLEKLYGVDIDYYFKINLNGGIKLIDALGGITVYSEEAFTDIHGTYYSQGYNDLNGDMAMKFVRERKHVTDGDVGRGKNQMALMKAVLKKMLETENLKNFDNILMSLQDSFRTDVPTELLYSIVKSQLNDPKKWEISTITVNGSYANCMCYSYRGNPLSVVLPSDEDINNVKGIIGRNINTNNQ